MRKYLNKLLAKKGYELQKIGVAIYHLKRLVERKHEIRFIQVGANDGVNFDNIYPFFMDNNCSGLLIEPLPNFFSRLKMNYADKPKIVPLNVALHPSEKSINIYSVNPKSLQKYPHWIAGIASFDINHIRKQGVTEEDIESTQVQCRTLMGLVKEYDLTNLDYLQIDTEGFDDEIIKMIDFSLVRPSVIKFETVHLSETKKKNIVQLLKSNGYRIVDERRDMVAINVETKMI